MMSERLCSCRIPQAESLHRRRGISPPSAPVRTIPTYFQQPCPTCGRRLLIRVEHLGRQVSCSHCCRLFTARDASQQDGDPADDGRSVTARAERLLALLEASSRPRRTYCA